MRWRPDLLGEIHRHLGKIGALFELLQQRSVLALGRSISVVASSFLRLRTCASFTGVTTICEMRYWASATLNCARYWL